MVGVASLGTFILLQWGRSFWRCGKYGHQRSGHGLVTVLQWGRSFWRCGKTQSDSRTPPKGGFNGAALFGDAASVPSCTPVQSPCAGFNGAAPFGDAARATASVFWRVTPTPCGEDGSVERYKMELTPGLDSAEAVIPARTSPEQHYRLAFAHLGRRVRSALPVRTAQDQSGSHIRAQSDRPPAQQTSR